MKYVRRLQMFLRRRPNVAVISTRPIIEQTAPQHEEALKRADAVLRTIDDFRAMEAHVVGKRNR